jgi:hypothetical protein
MSCKNKIEFISNITVVSPSYTRLPLYRACIEFKGKSTSLSIIKNAWIVAVMRNILKETGIMQWLKTEEGLANLYFSDATCNSEDKQRTPTNMKMFGYRLFAHNRSLTRDNSLFTCEFSYYGPKVGETDVNSYECEMDIKDREDASIRKLLDVLGHQILKEGI